MKKIIILLITIAGIIILVTACGSMKNEQEEKTIKEIDTIEENRKDSNATIHSGISAIDSKFPLTMSTIDFTDYKKHIHLNDDINSKIEQTIKDYYFNECSGDTAETYFSIRDTYFNTIRLHDSLQIIYIVILRHVPDGLVNSKILFYNNSSKRFIGKAIDFNLHALYEFDNGNFKPTNLKEQLKITDPEIELVVKKKNGTNNYKLTRLYHNGTANAIETTILQVSGNKIDTLDFKQKWIQ